MTAGIATQATAINNAQTFSQDQRPKYRMGSVKVPFMRPERTANRIPASKVGLLIIEATNLHRSSEL